MRPPDLPRPKDVGISISESPDMAGFAIHLLASGANLAYGGDLRGLLGLYRLSQCRD